MSTTPSSSKKAPSPSAPRQGQHLCQVTRAVQTMSSFHQTSVTSTARKYFYSRTHFPKILGGIMAIAGISGYCCMGFLHDKQMEDRKRIYVEAYHHNSNGDQQRNSTPSNNLLTSSGSTATSVNLISSDAMDSVNRKEENRLVSLARKLTHRIVTTSHDDKEASIQSSLQRQVTKFW